MSNTVCNRHRAISINSSENVKAESIEADFN
jgi:hypothetical protein